MSDPDYLKYLLNPDLNYDSYFIVGNPELNTPVEKIGVVKKMLLAHSVVMRTELQESKLAENDNVSVIDIYPDTFKNMLRYVYGFDNTAVLSFDEADNLLYAAEKYMICSLKDKLARHLMGMLDYTNICSLMNNPACFRVLELNSQITKILKYETEHVLASPQFLGLSPEPFLKILQQEKLSVNELEIWRAAIKWAENRVGGEEGKALRKELTRHVEHIRVCTLTLEDLCYEVFPREVLTPNEIKLVCLSAKSGEKQTDLTTVCNDLNKRPQAVMRFPIDVNLPSLSVCGSLRNSTLKLVTKGSDIELVSMMLNSFNLSGHQCNSTISIQKDDEASVAVNFNEQVNGEARFLVPISNNGQTVHLLANSSYNIRFTVCAHFNHCVYYSNMNQTSYTNDHFTVHFEDWSSYYISHVNKIVYKTTKKK